MSRAIDVMWEVCDALTKSPRFVTISEENIVNLSDKIKTYFNNNPIEPWGPPAIFNDEYFHETKSGVVEIKECRYSGACNIPYLYRKIVVFELIAGAINYQYWYGRYDLRPGGSGSTKMYKLLTEAFRSSDPICCCVNKFVQSLVSERFTILSKRIEHIREVISIVSSDIKDNFDYNISHLARYGYWIGGFKTDQTTVLDALDRLISLFPGYAEDILLKRASLFFIELYRRMGWFKDSIYLLPVPADYQIPRVLNHLRCINYSLDLTSKINKGELLSKGSLEECEIRAATIIACKRISELAGCKMCDVDTFLYSQSKDVKSPFHLTITTDY